MRELGKQYSRLEMAVLKLKGRDVELFNICKQSIENGRKERAIIYANEIAEIRKILSSMTHTQLSLERVILRLETIEEVCPSLQELKGVFGDVENVLKLMVNVMPNVYPEISELNNTISEILGATQIDSIPSVEPLVIQDSSTETILQEAAGVLEEELKNKIPEPPISATAPLESSRRAMIALTANGPETYMPKDEPQQSTPLLEELIMDYLERSKGEVDLARCAAELNISTEKVLEMLKALNIQGKIKIEQ